MIVITGATGNIGRVISDRLLSKGSKVRVLGRDQKRLQLFVDRGADARAGSMDDGSFLKNAFAGATAVFTMIPPYIQAPDSMGYQDTIGKATAEALKAAGVNHVVNLSSVGAERDCAAGPITGLRRQEERLNSLDANVLHLRPGFFMENFLMHIPMIRNMGIIGSPLKPDAPLGMIATRDIGIAAAEHLAILDFQGKSHRLLLGPKDVRMPEAAGILGNSIGKPDLPYVQFGYEDAEKGMAGAGISPSVAQSYNEMYRAVNEGKIYPYPRTPETETPTTLEEFSKTFAAAYQSESK